MIDDACANDRGQGARGVRLRAELISDRTVRGDRAERLEHVVVHDQRDGHLGIERTPHRVEEAPPDLLEVEGTREGGREAEDRAEDLLLLLALGTRAREGRRESMHDHGGDEAEAEPDGEGHVLYRAEDVAGVPPRHHEAALGELNGVDPLDGEKDHGGVEGRRRHVQAQRAGEPAHLSAVGAQSYRLACALDMASEGEGDDHAALRAIWQEHRAATLDRVAVLERAAALALGGQLTDAERANAKQEAHTLAGTVAFFGFREASRIASEIQRFFAEGRAPDPEWLRDRLAKLRGALEGLPYTS